MSKWDKLKQALGVTPKIEEAPEKLLKKNVGRHCKQKKNLQLKKEDRG